MLSVGALRHQLQIAGIQNEIVTIVQDYVDVVREQTAQSYTTALDDVLQIEEGVYSTDAPTNLFISLNRIIGMQLLLSLYRLLPLS